MVLSLCKWYFWSVDIKLREPNTPHRRLSFVESTTLFTSKCQRSPCPQWVSTRSKCESCLWKFYSMTLWMDFRGSRIFIFIAGWRTTFSSKLFCIFICISGRTCSLPHLQRGKPPRIAPLPAFLLFWSRWVSSSTIGVSSKPRVILRLLLLNFSSWFRTRILRIVFQGDWTAKNKQIRHLISQGYFENSQIKCFTVRETQSWKCFQVIFHWCSLLNKGPKM